MKEKIYIWGTGKIAEEVLNDCKNLSEYEILGFIDNNPDKEGCTFFQKTIYNPQILSREEFDRIVVLTVAYDSIYKQVKKDFPQYIDCLEDRNFFYKQSILKRYEKTNDLEVQEILNFIKHNGLKIYNYEFCDKYKNVKADINFDEQKNLYYVMHNGKKMYLARKYNTENAIEEYYRAILMEQDACSPHRYLAEDFNVEENGIVIDAGVAEGNFSLEIVDKVRKLYLIEADDEWIEALEATFQEYKDKVVIIKAFLSSYNEGMVATLDTLVKESIDFIKMDIEGSEWDALCGAENIIKNSPKLKIAACAYHADGDMKLIEDFMDKNHIVHDTTRGYMWFPYKVKQDYVSTQLSRGIVRGVRKE